MNVVNVLHHNVHWSRMRNSVELYCVDAINVFMNRKKFHLILNSASPWIHKIFCSRQIHHNANICITITVCKEIWMLFTVGLLLRLVGLQFKLETHFRRPFSELIQFRSKHINWKFHFKSRWAEVKSIFQILHNFLDQFTSWFSKKKMKLN